MRFYSQLIKAILLLCVGLNSQTVLAEWVLERDENDIQTFYESPTKDYLRFQATAKVSADINEVIALFTDVERCKEWVYLCVSAKLLKNDTDPNNSDVIYVYQKYDFPYPFSDREIFFQATINKLQDNQTYYIEIISTKNPCERSNSRKKCSNDRDPVTMHSLEASYLIKATADGGVTIHWEQYLNPGNDMSTSIANNELKKVPYETLTKLKELLENKRTFQKGPQM